MIFSFPMVFYKVKIEMLFPIECLIEQKKKHFLFTYKKLLKISYKAISIRFCRAISDV